MKKHTKRIIVLILTMILTTGATYAYWASSILVNNDTKENMIQIGEWVPPGYVGIYNGNQLISAASNSSSNIKYIIMNDIELSRTTPLNSFQTGIIDGNGYKITNTEVFTENYHRRTNVLNFGLFQTIGSNATIKNLVLENIKVMVYPIINNGAWYFHNSGNVGILTGYNYGTIENVAIKGGSLHYEHVMNRDQGGPGTIYARSGSIAGYNQGTIKNTYSTASISAISNRGGGASSATGTGQVIAQMGGLVGYNSGHISYSYTTGLISGAAYNNTNTNAVTRIPILYGSGLIGFHTSGTVISNFIANPPIILEKNNPGESTLGYNVRFFGGYVMGNMNQNIYRLNTTTLARINSSGGASYTNSISLSKNELLKSIAGESIAETNNVYFNGWSLSGAWNIYTGMTDYPKLNMER